MRNSEWIKNRFHQYGGYLVLGMVAVLLEILLFHARALFSAGETEAVIAPADLSVENAQLSENGEMILLGDEGRGQLYLTGLQKYLDGQKLKNVRLDLALPQAFDDEGRVSGICKMQIYVRDAGHDRYAPLGEHIYREDVADSHYLWMEVMNPVKTVVLDLKLSEGNVLQIEQIVLNAYKPMAFSVWRCLILFVIMAAVYALRINSILWKKSVKEAGRSEVVLTVCVGILLLTPAFVLNGAKLRDVQIAGFRPYQELAEALAAGQVHLLREPSEKLMALENPYDYTARLAAGLADGIDYPWDTAYYNGHYYTYFGVVPCILIYLPFYLLTRSHIPDVRVVLGLAIFLYAGIYLLVRTWLMRQCKDIRWGDVMMGACGVFLASGIMICMGSPDAHDIPRIAGVVLTVWGLYFWLCACGGEVIRRKPLAVGSLLMALAVGCRPNLALYSFLAIPLFGGYLSIEDKSAVLRKALPALLLPYLPVAIGLMVYNAVRFGSITDFGFAYNLTVLDCTKPNISLDVFVVGFYEFFLRIPRMQYVFPYLQEGSFAQLNQLGHASFYYTYGYGGMLVCNPILLALPAIFGKKNRRPENICLVGIVLLNALITIGLGGVAYHYMMDFAAFLILAGWTGAILLKEKIEDVYGLRIFERFLRGGFLFSVFFYSCFYFAGSLQTSDTALYYRILYALGI